MLKNHFTIALRRLVRRPAQTALHMLGLGIGLAACLVVLLYALHEHTYDGFHANGDRLYKVYREIHLGDRTFRSSGIVRSNAATLQARVPGLEAVVEVGETQGLVRVPATGLTTEEKHVLFATRNAFEAFTFPLIRGDKASALDAPDGALVTASLAARLFGNDDPVGQTITYEQTGLRADSTRTAYRVTGIAADPPGNSTLQFSIVLPVPEVAPETEFSPVFLNASFALLRSPADTTALLNALTADLADTDDAEIADVRLVPMASLHTDQREGDTQPLYFFGTMALFVLVIACINYTNLATAQATQRAREIGVRKTLGASSALLRRQLLTEALLLALGGGVLAVLLALAAPEAFRAAFDITLAVTPLSVPWTLAALLGLAVLTGLVAGLYPAFSLARRHPIRALHLARAPERGRIRQALVVVQFALAIGMIAATFVVDQQLRFGQGAGGRYAGDQIVTLDFSAPAVQRQSAVLRDALAQVPGVTRAVRASAAPGGMFVGLSGTRAGEGAPNEMGIVTSILTAEAGYPEVFGLRLLAGRDLRADEHRTAVVLNETAAREYGLMTDRPEEAIGQRVEIMGPREVVGVVEDFVFSSVRDPIRPLALTAPNPDAAISSGFVMVGGMRVIAAEIEAGRVREALAGMEQAWHRIAPDYPFTYRFVDEAFAEGLRVETRTRAIFGVAALLAALLACLGLFGLATFAVAQRTKEIGIRKALGATVAGLVGLLSRDFAALVAAAFALAAPITYVLMEQWLERFAYRIDVRVGVLAAAGGLVLALAVATVGYHALRAARTNPVKALRYE